MSIYVVPNWIAINATAPFHHSAKGLDKNVVNFEDEKKIVNSKIYPYF